MANKLYTDIYNLINDHDRILIMPSSPPDGDSLGSALALYLLLKKIGKEVTVVCADPVPESFKFLPTSNVISNQFAASSDFIVTLDCSRAQIADIQTKIENDKVNIVITPKSGNLSERGVSFSYGATNYELIIVVDTGDLQQLGRFYEDNTDLFTRIPVINIDHHTSNSQYGKINLVDIMAPSTTEVIMYLIESFPNGKELLDEDIATLLLAGIITDTGSFQNANTTPRAFAAASHLLGYGARQQEIVQHVYKTKNLSTLKLWGRVLSKIKTDEKFKMVWSTISQNDLMDTDSHQEETGDIIDELMTNAPGAEIVMLIKEKETGLVSVSVRTTHAGVDASALAEMFGGGGHTQAAGFRVKGKDIQSAEQEIVEKVKEFQGKRLFIPEEEIEATNIAQPLSELEKTPAVETANPPVVKPILEAESISPKESLIEMTEKPLVSTETNAPNENPSSLDSEIAQEPTLEQNEVKEMTKKFFTPNEIEKQINPEAPKAESIPPKKNSEVVIDNFSSNIPVENVATFELPENNSIIANENTPTIEKSDTPETGLQFDLNPGENDQL